MTMCILTALVKICKKTLLLLDNKQYYVTFNNNKQRGQICKSKNTLQMKLKQA